MGDGGSGWWAPDWLMSGVRPDSGRCADWIIYNAPWRQTTGNENFIMAYSVNWSRLAGVASVSVEQRAKNGFSAFWPREKWGESKNRKKGVGEGNEGNACGQTSWFWKPPFASERSSCLARLVKHYWHVSNKGLKVPSAGRNVRGLFTKSVNVSHGP